MAARPDVVPDELRPFVMGARLVALGKKDGGTRPVAVGTVLRKVVAQCIAHSIKGQLQQTFAPHQFGVGMPGGAECVLTALRAQRAAHPEHDTLISVDFSNAFNTVLRAQIAKQVKRTFPELAAWVEQTYIQPSLLTVEGRPPLCSCRGVQQGDPLGPFLFALALQPVLQLAAQRTGAMVVAYLDDIYILGPKEAALKAFAYIEQVGGAIGLACNKRKCWTTNVDAAHSAGIRLDRDPRVLGSWLITLRDVPKNKEALTISERIAHLPDPQVALLMLRFMHNSKTLYTLKTLPPGATQTVCESQMKKTKECLEVIMGLGPKKHLSDASWLQAQLPQGPGLGLLDLHGLASLAYSACLIQSLHKLAKLDPSRFLGITQQPEWDRALQVADTAQNAMRSQGLKREDLGDDELAAMVAREHMMALDLWRRTLTDANSDVVPAQLFKNFAARLKVRRIETFLEDPKVPEHNKTIVRSAQHSPIASHMFNAIPSQKGLALNPSHMRIMLHLLLGVEMEFESNVCSCGQVQDPLGVHALCCSLGGNLIRRHDLVKNLLATMCDAANIPYLKEPVHYFEDDTNLRPDIVLPCHTPAGCDVALDVCVTTPTCASLAGNGALRQDGQLPLQRREMAKNKKYMRHARDKCIFYPVVFSAYGGTTILNIKMVLDPIIRRITKRRFCSPNWAAPDKRSYWYQRIAVALWNGVTSCVEPHLKLGPAQLYEH